MTTVRGSRVRPTALADADAELQRATRAVLTALAVDALTVGEGGRLPTGSEYRERFHVGAGTVQKAIELLISAGALEVASRGHLGRHIRAIDIARLWHLAALPPVRALLPPRGPLEVRAIAEVLTQEFARLEVPFALEYVRGGSDRESRVVAGDADVAVVSAGYSDATESDSAVVERVRLPDSSFYSEDRMLVLRARDGRRTRRVAIDSSSFDQSRLTRAEFPENDGFEYVELDFPRVPVAILQDEVDAGVWHEMQTLIPPAVAGLEVDALGSAEAKSYIARSSAAMLLLSPSRPELTAVISQVNLDRVDERRRELMGLRADDPQLLDLNWTV